MLTYEKLIQTISAIVNSDEIYKKDLTLLYELPEKLHKQMDEHLFYKANPSTIEFIHRDEIELEVADIKVKFIKKEIE
jgi:hypothetical protein